MEIKKLKELCYGKGEYGIAASGEEFSEDKLRYLRISDISDYGELLDIDKKSVSCEGCEEYLLKKDDIVFARTGNSTGRAFLYEEKYGPLVYAGFLICFHLNNEKVNPKYVKYYTISRTYKNWIENGPTGSTRGNMSEGDFADMPIILPKREFQDKIVALLDPIIEKIECNSKLEKDYYGIIKTMYEYWFQQYDFPNEESKPYKSSGGKMIYNEVLKREIPISWSCKMLKDIAEQETTSITPQEQQLYWHYSIPAFDESKYPSLEYGRDIDSNKYSVPSHSYLVSKLNPQFKRLWIVGDTDSNSICSTEFIPFVAKKNSELLFSILNSEEFYIYMVNSSSSSTGSRKRMDPELCKIFKIALPNDEGIINRFEENIKPFIQALVEINEDSNRLKRLRDFIIPLALNECIKIK